MFTVYPYLNVNDLNLDWIIAHFKEFIDEIDGLNNWKTEHEAEYRELKKLYDDLMAGNYPDSFKNSLIDWIQRNLYDIVGDLIKAVHFGLTNDGYFCAYIPTSWSDVTFDTVEDFDDPLYGHLMLIYD